MSDVRMDRIISHWTGGTGRANSLDLKHYHKLTEFDGRQRDGNEEIADNVVTSDGDYAAHTLNLNTRSIGVAMCGMAGATERPFNAGEYPLTEVQFEAHCELIAELCNQYNIPVTPTTVLSHAEVEPNLGVKQRNKWDYIKLPFRQDLHGARACGDYMRERVKFYLGAQPEYQGFENMPTLRLGSRGRFVEDLQTLLKGLGYSVGAVDGIYGRGTEGGVMKFQAAEGLGRDGVTGPNTWRRLYEAGKEKRENPVVAARKELTTADIRAAGSRTINDTDKAQAGVVTSGVMGMADTYLDTAQSDPIAAAEKLAADKARVEALGFGGDAMLWLQDNWLLVIGGIVLLYSLFKMYQVKGHRTEDARNAKHMG